MTCIESESKWMKKWHPAHQDRTPETKTNLCFLSESRSQTLKSCLSRVVSKEIQLVSKNVVYTNLILECRFFFVLDEANQQPFFICENRIHKQEMYFLWKVWYIVNYERKFLYCLWNQRKMAFSCFRRLKFVFILAWTHRQRCVKVRLSFALEHFIYEVRLQILSH